MAKVWLTLWECAGDNLPACCIVCGCEEEIEHLDREMEYRPRWPFAFLGLHFIGWHVLGGVLGFFSERSNQVVLTRFPYCPDHYGYWHKRDRRHHLGLLILALGWLLPFLVTFINNNNRRLSSQGIVIVAVATAIGLIVIFSCGFKIIHIANMKKIRVLVADVHPDFAAATEHHRDHIEHHHDHDKW
jgi:hypothetical protein